MITLMFYQNFNAASEKILVPKTVHYILVYFPIYLKFMNDVCMIIPMITLMFYQNFNAASEKILVPKTVHYIW